MADILENWEIKGVKFRDNKALNDARIACASGTMPKIAAAIAADGLPTSPVAELCTAVVGEAVKRGRDGGLYVAMQPDNPLKEYKAILAASGKNKDRYVNAEGVTKELGCELAFDAGYVYASDKPNKVIAPKTPDAKIDEITRFCFDKKIKTPTINGLIAGARKAQAAAKKTKISEAEIERPEVPSKPQAKTARGSAIGG